MTTCRSCNADVFFVPSAATGRRMILDAEPILNGNVEIADGLAYVLREGPLADARAKMLRGTGKVYTSHHATCPQAADWRKSKR